MNPCRIFFYKSLNFKQIQLRRINTITRQTPAEYCLHLIRKHDYEGFLCTLLLPNNLRSPAVAIKAFNTEIALVEDQVSDDNIGLMRLKFWEESLQQTFDGKPPKNPACLELHRVLKKHKLSKHYFKRLIEARYNRLNGSLFADLDSVEKYAEQTVSSIYYLMLEAQGIQDVDTDHFASHFGKAHGILNLIRSVPYSAQKRIILLPQDILMKYNISSESVFQGRGSKELNDVIFEVSSRAKQHLNKALSMRNKIKKESKIIFLPSLIIENYLEKLRRIDFNIFDPQLQRRDNLLPLKLYWKKLFLR
ncbi:NADH dehydrogenase (ubiquinone) complex I, assembly factor 6 [Trichogramma pretiosum]|uniref:NADH dehydrogenase (ubiquinone) complex I, assembly factor 6 n=1 Tax=Trichogramma pretiosum TaxID=7493 RepID=UPI0006C989D9|nr:NADH dehydrogenase (ubiquinone) complex I, assembly factor 6 [Trichogramma pretiosum]